MKLNVKKGSTNVTVYVFVQDSSKTDGSGLTGLVFNSSGLVCYYVRPLGSATQLTLATQTVTGAHSDGGFVEVDSTNMPGIYRLDLSDTIVSSGVDSVVVMLKGAANMAPVVLELELIDNTSKDIYDRVGAPAGSSIAADIAAQNDLSAAEVNTEVDTALSDIGLDHLLAASVAGTDVTDDSIIAKLVSASATADWDDFVNTTDALQAIRDKQTDIETDTQDIQSRLPAALVGGRMDSSVGAMAADSLTASALAADAVDEILDEIVEDSATAASKSNNFTLRDVCKIVLAAVAGRTTNGGLTMKTPDNSQERVVASLTNAERSSMTLKV